MELSNLQKTIIETTEKYVVCISGAGAGKTRVLTERIRYLLARGVKPTKIVAITFTNCAAEEILERISHPQGLFVGTVHSYASYLLRAHGETIDRYINDNNFDGIIERVNALPSYAKDVEYLFLDEGQDSTDLQFHFIFDVIKPKSWMVFSDHRQCIYEYNGADPRYVLDLTLRPDVVTYQLNENYRCGKKILNFARNIMRGLDEEYLDFSKAMREVDGIVQAIPYNGEAIALEFANMIDGHGQWFVLTRTNKQLEEMAELFRKYKVPFDTFKRAEISNTELNRLMRKDTVKLLTIHASKGLEAPNVLVVGARKYSREERCVSYVAATRAKDRLVWAEIATRRNQSIGHMNRAF